MMISINRWQIKSRRQYLILQVLECPLNLVDFIFDLVSFQHSLTELLVFSRLNFIYRCVISNIHLFPIVNEKSSLPRGKKWGARPFVGSGLWFSRSLFSCYTIFTRESRTSTIASALNSMQRLCHLQWTITISFSICSLVYFPTFWTASESYEISIVELFFVASSVKVTFSIPFSSMTNFIWNSSVFPDLWMMESPPTCSLSELVSVRSVWPVPVWYSIDSQSVRLDKFPGKNSFDCQLLSRCKLRSEMISY